MTMHTVTQIQGHNLFFEGNIHCYDTTPWVAVIGGRNPSSEAEFAVEKVIDFLYRCGYGVINGLAKGVDAMALKEAQKRGMPTIGVIAGGLSVPHYPRETRDIRSACTLVLSEYPDHTPIQKAQFLERNKVIVDLADAVVALEGGNGTTNAIRYALKQRKDVIGSQTSLSWLIARTGKVSVHTEYFIKMNAKIGFEERQFLRNQNNKG